MRNGIKLQPAPTGPRPPLGQVHSIERAAVEVLDRLDVLLEGEEGDPLFSVLRQTVRNGRRHILTTAQMPGNGGDPR